MKKTIFFLSVLVFVSIPPENRRRVTVYKEGGAPAVFQSPECPGWSLPKHHDSKRPSTTGRCQSATRQGRRKYLQDRTFCTVDLRIPFPGIRDTISVAIVAVFDVQKLGFKYVTGVFHTAYFFSSGYHIFFFVQHIKGNVDYASQMPEKLGDYVLHIGRIKFTLSKIFSGDFHLEILKESLLKAIDAAFSKEASRYNVNSGSTAAVILIADSQILAVNVGDSKAFLCSQSPEAKATLLRLYEKRRREGASIRMKDYRNLELAGLPRFAVKELTMDHHPDRVDERSRVEAAGGSVSEWAGLKPETNLVSMFLISFGVISAPEVTDWQPLTANDSIWWLFLMVFLKSWAHRMFVIYSLELQYSPSCSYSLADCIVDTALERGSMDNVAAVVVPFGLENLPTEGSRVQNYLDGQSDFAMYFMIGLSAFQGSYSSRSALFLTRKFKNHKQIAYDMALVAHRFWLIFYVGFLTLLLMLVNADDIFLEWKVNIDTMIKPVLIDQPVITINGMFPGPLINATTNDNIHVNVFNNMDEPLLITWNGIQQRLNSWQDGVSGTNCPIQPGFNWTYVFTVKDQIGTFSYFPSINFHKAGGAFGPIRVNNRVVIPIPFPKPHGEFDLLIGDWYNESFKDVRSSLKKSILDLHPKSMLLNGRSRYPQSNQTIVVEEDETYLLRISNVGTQWSINFRIQNHQMLLVETEGSYTSQIMLDSIDIHVGQSYSVLVTTNQPEADYYIVASPKMVNAPESSNLVEVGVLHYEPSTTPVQGPLPAGPDPFDLKFSVNQAKSIRWNLTAGAARRNPQGTFNVSNVTLSQTFILQGSLAEINRSIRYTVNNVSYQVPNTALKLADYYKNGTGTYQLDAYPSNSSNPIAIDGTLVVSGTHNGWLEIVFKNNLQVIDTWHFDGFGFYVVGFGDGEWTPNTRSTYNLYDPVVRSTVQVYPGGWTAVYAYLDNPGMWNLRSQVLNHWYLGQELYIRVYDPDPNPAKERQPPSNLLYCGSVIPPPAPPKPTPVPPTPSHTTTLLINWFYVLLISFFTCALL
ncbi:hypothetical protein L1987_34968 [Smallanthus sonchifolius]|uniref:Uncharacterized protein n=1 Tax=Smallanthus sonchifolius TaxID=185202 RepID=A0ACB9HVB1_9ASTR|nr:hypothetical protein L1987_34968 [Smallanthus sonchifolius]